MIFGGDTLRGLARCCCWVQVEIERFSGGSENLVHADYLCRWSISRVQAACNKIHHFSTISAPLYAAQSIK